MSKAKHPNTGFRIASDIRHEWREFLSEHPEFNASGFFNQKIREKLLEEGYIERKK